MAARLTDKQKKKIIADYVELGSYNAVAKKHKVSVDTVKRTVLQDDETVKKRNKKRTELCQYLGTHGKPEGYRK